MGFCGVDSIDDSLVFLLGESKVCWEDRGMMHGKADQVVRVVAGWCPE